MSDAKIDVLGIATNPLGNRSNPVCVAIANQEDADRYEFMYNSIEGMYNSMEDIPAAAETRVVIATRHPARSSLALPRVPKVCNSCLWCMLKSIFCHVCNRDG